MLASRFFGPVAKQRFPTFTKLTTCTNALAKTNTPSNTIISHTRPVLPRVSRRMTSGLNGSLYDEDISNLRSWPFWGFLIHHCDYHSDSAWDTFIQRWSDRAKEYTELHHSGTGCAGRLRFTVKEDKANLDGADVQYVHKLFAKWIRSGEAFKEYREVEFGRFLFPRYSHCVHVDAQALDSCMGWFELLRDKEDQFRLSPRDPELGIAAYVNIVRVGKELVLTPELTEMVLPRYPEDEEFDYDCDDDDDDDDDDDQGPVSIKMHLPCVLPHMYARMFHVDDTSRWAAGLRRDEDGVYFW